VSKLLEAALELAARGTKVFPVGPDKAPRTPNGYYDATTKPEVIRAWDWNGNGMIGAAIAPGTIVIDVDPRNGGDKTLTLLKGEGKELPPTRCVKTKSGGFHYHFAVPDEITLRGKLGPGVDVKRAGKGYVVTPPSPGYTLLNDTAPVAAPEWLLEELAIPEAEPGTDEASDPKFFPWEDGTPYGMAALEREMGRLITTQEGGRNDALNRAAFALAQLAAGGEISRKAALRAMTEAAPRIGLDFQECRATIESGWKAGIREPRQAPPPHERLDAESFIAPAKTVEVLPLGSAEPIVVSNEPRPVADESRFWVDWEVDEPAPPFYCHPLIPKNAYVLVYGATEASKSMVWMGLLCEASHRGIRSSFYSLENPPHTDRDRLRRWQPVKDNFRLTNEPIDLNDPRQLGALVEREKTWGTDILVLDTYSHAFNSRSEDGNAKAIEFARRIRHVMHEVGCSVVLVDHTGYAQEDEPRDASAKRQQVDCAILMKKAGEWRPGQPARFTMTNKKAARFANPCHLTGEIRDTKGDIRGLELGWLGERPRWEPTA
jgi:Bifunctional DNA primase/polymerase, N-terminal/AAA domain